MFFVHGNNHWQSLTNKRTGEFLSAKTMREKFGGLNIMKSVLSLEETPSALERSLKASTKLRRELPTDLEMETIPLGNFLPWLSMFMLRRERHRRIPALS